jgi:amino acid transporter
LTNIEIQIIINSVKKLFVSISGLLVYPFLAQPAFAADVSPCGSNVTGIAKVLCGLGSGNVASTIQGIVVFLVILAVVIALIYLLYGGIKWITSRGEKTEVEAARNHIIAAIIGLIVVFLAVAILSIVLTVFGIDWKDLTLPKIGPGI